MRTAKGEKEGRGEMMDKELEEDKMANGEGLYFTPSEVILRCSPGGLLGYTHRKLLRYLKQEQKRRLKLGKIDELDVVITQPPYENNGSK